MKINTLKRIGILILLIVALAASIDMKEVSQKMELPILPPIASDLTRNV